MMVDSPTPMSRAASEIDVCMTRSACSSTNSATVLSDGLKPSIALLIRIRQPALAGAVCLVEGIQIFPITRASGAESLHSGRSGGLAHSSMMYSGGGDLLQTRKFVKNYFKGGVQAGTQQPSPGFKGAADSQLRSELIA